MMRDERVGELSEMPLTAAPIGAKVRLRSVDAGRALEARLAALGIVTGVDLEVIIRGRMGPIVVGVRSARVMLGRAMANRMMVQLMH